KDENVFDIQQGVAIIVAVKKARLGSSTVEYASLHGSRAAKNDFLWGHDLNRVGWKTVTPRPETFYIFSDRNFDGSTVYRDGFSAGELFGLSSISMQRGSDATLVAESAAKLQDSLGLKS